MDVREKLVELLSEIIDGGFKWYNYLYESGEQLNNDEIASYLIANGVTAQEWISVNDMLPEPTERAICINCDGDMMIGTYTEWGWMFPCYFKRPTHWMPLPQPPKGE